MAVAATSIFNLSTTASVALTRYRAVTGAGAIPAAGANVLGWAMVSVNAGERVTCTVWGTAVAEAGAAITVGAAIEVDSQGRAVPRSTGVMVGRALTAAAAAGDQVEIYCFPQ